MTKAIVNNFNATEAATEALFAENAKAVYAPLFKVVTDRETAFALFSKVRKARQLQSWPMTCNTVSAMRKVNTSSKAACRLSRKLSFSPVTR